MHLAKAHVDLAKAEASAIGWQLARLAGLIAAGIGLVLMAGLLLVIGTSLFLGEWLLGSLGWGVLHGFLAFIAIAMACMVAAVGVSGQRIGRAFLVALAMAILVSVVLGFDLLNRLYTWIGDQGVAIEAGVRPLVVGLAVGLIVGIVLAVLGALRWHGSVLRSAIVGAFLGLILGALTAVTYGPHVGTGIGIAIGWIAWMAILGTDVARTGVDVDALKARFYPTQTIETSKETLEWLKQRMPPGIG